VSCDRFPLIKMRIRVARAAARSGQCALATGWLKRAERDLRAGTATRSSMGPCERVVAKSTGQSLVDARRELRERCGRP
jgi:hypothetical protein